MIIATWWDGNNRVDEFKYKRQHYKAREELLVWLLAPQYEVAAIGGDVRYTSGIVSSID